jgi:hypothetical protein
MLFPTLGHNQSVTITDPITETGPNGDQWLAGDINGDVHKTVYADITQMANQQELAGSNGSLYYVETGDVNGNTSDFKLEDNKYVAEVNGHMQQVGYAEEKGVNL